MSRAEKVCSQLSRQLRASEADSSGGNRGVMEEVDRIERDMDVKLEKEAQRTALIRVREIAMGDVNFSAACK